MSQPVSPRLQQAIEIAESLSPDEQRQLIGIVRQRLIQYQRAELVREVAEARQAYQQGQVSRGTVADLMRELDQPTVIRTSRGLSIAGTRITLYDIMDYLTANWPTELVRDWFNLTDQQMADVMDYIETHRSEVEAEYQLVLQQAEETRRYWERRNQEHFAQIAAALRAPKPGQEDLRAKLAAWKAQLEAA
jgi:uncharacterized protein (DUF433 family)